MPPYTHTKDFPLLQSSTIIYLSPEAECSPVPTSGSKIQSGQCGTLQQQQRRSSSRGVAAAAGSRRPLPAWVATGPAACPRPPLLCTHHHPPKLHNPGSPGPSEQGMGRWEQRSCARGDPRCKCLWRGTPTLSLLASSDWCCWDAAADGLAGNVG